MLYFDLKLSPNPVDFKTSLQKVGECFHEQKERLENHDRFTLLTIARLQCNLLKSQYA